MKRSASGEPGFTLIEMLIVLAILGILVGITALAAPGFMQRATVTAGQAELEIVQRAMWAYQVSDEVQVVPTAECVVDLGASEPALYPRFVRDRVPGQGRAYSWDQRGIVYPCGEAPAEIGEGNAAYYANATLSGSPVLMRDDGAIGFTWGTGSPAEGVPANGFSVRWRYAVTAEEPSILRLKATADDGVRVFLDGEKVLDLWAKGGEGATEVPIGEGSHSLVAEYYDAAGQAHVAVVWAVQSQAQTGRGAFYAGQALKGKPLLEREELAIDYDWGRGSPAPGLPANNFSARWELPLEAEESGTYRFTATVDDGARVYVNGTQVINAWGNQQGRTVSGQIALPAGSHTVVMEYREGNGDAMARLSWERVDLVPGPKPGPGKPLPPPAQPFL